MFVCVHSASADQEDKGSNQELSPHVIHDSLVALPLMLVTSRLLSSPRSHTSRKDRSLTPDLVHSFVFLTTSLFLLLVVVERDRSEGAPSNTTHSLFFMLDSVFHYKTQRLNNQDKQRHDTRIPIFPPHVSSSSNLFVAVLCFRRVARLVVVCVGFCNADASFSYFFFSFSSTPRLCNWRHTRQ